MEDNININYENDLKIQNLISEIDAKLALAGHKRVTIDQDIIPTVNKANKIIYSFGVEFKENKSEFYDTKKLYTLCLSSVNFEESKNDSRFQGILELSLCDNNVEFVNENLLILGENAYTLCLKKEENKVEILSDIDNTLNLILTNQGNVIVNGKNILLIGENSYSLCLKDDENQSKLSVLDDYSWICKVHATNLTDTCVISTWIYNYYDLNKEEQDRSAFIAYSMWLLYNLTRLTSETFSVVSNKYSLLLFPKWYHIFIMEEINQQVNELKITY